MPQPFKLDSKWRDVSDYVVHFTRHEATLTSILTERRLKASKPFGWVYQHPNRGQLSNNQVSACFTEVPRDHYTRMVDRHGSFGVVFEKSLIVASGGARVWYVDRDSAVGTHLSTSIALLEQESAWDHPFWSLTPFFEPRIPGRHQWEWEREWRVPGDFVWDSDDAVIGVLAPESAREKFGELGFQVRPPLD
ncbi:hypothetical protein [Rhodococcus qingshengii]|jgi:hypothetical protein|nr:hypothetical protein [Rhodococcus qingshengii]MDJ0430644.1 hypothetical protein [Rhodococcus qingshengii]